MGIVEQQRLKKVQRERRIEGVKRSAVPRIGKVRSTGKPGVANEALARFAVNLEVAGSIPEHKNIVMSQRPERFGTKEWLEYQGRCSRMIMFVEQTADIVK